MDGYEGLQNSNFTSMFSGCCHCLAWLLICATCPISVPILMIMCCLGSACPFGGDYFSQGLGEEAPAFTDYSGTV